MKSNLLLRLPVSAFVLMVLFCTATLSAQKLENPTKLYRGIVSLAGSSDVAHDGIIYVYEDPYPTPVTSSKLNTGTGEYSMILDPSKIYRLSVEAVGCYTSEFIIATPAGTNYEELDENFEVDPIPLDSVLYAGKPFAEGGAAFSDESGFRQMISFLVENPAVIVSINVGLLEDKVDAVTKKRVDAIKEMFRELEVSTTRIKWVRLVGEELGLFRVAITEFDPEG